MSLIFQHGPSACRVDDLNEGLALCGVDTCRSLQIGIGQFVGLSVPVAPTVGLRQDVAVRHVVEVVGEPVFRHAKIRGLGRNRIEGVHYASSFYVCRLNVRQPCPPGHPSKLAAVLFKIFKEDGRVVVSCPVDADAVKHVSHEE